MPRVFRREYRADREAVRRCRAWEPCRVWGGQWAGDRASDCSRAGWACRRGPGLRRGYGAWEVWDRVLRCRCRVWGPWEAVLQAAEAGQGPVWEARDGVPEGLQAAQRGWAARVWALPGAPVLPRGPPGRSSDPDPLRVRDPGQAGGQDGLEQPGVIAWPAPGEYLRWSGRRFFQIYLYTWLTPYLAGRTIQKFGIRLGSAWKSE